MEKDPKKERITVTVDYDVFLKYKDLQSGTGSSLVNHLLRTHFENRSQVEEAFQQTKETSEKLGLLKDILAEDLRTITGATVSLDDRVTFLTKMLGNLFGIPDKPNPFEPISEADFTTELRTAWARYAVSPDSLTPELQISPEKRALASAVHKTAKKNSFDRLKSAFQQLPFMQDDRFYWATNGIVEHLYDRTYSGQGVTEWSENPEHYPVLNLMFNDNKMLTLQYKKERPFFTLPGPDYRPGEAAVGFDEIMAKAPVIVADYIAYRRAELNR